MEQEIENLKAQLEEQTSQKQIEIELITNNGK